MIFDDVRIRYLDAVRNQDVVFYRCLTWIPHFAEVSRKVFGAHFSPRKYGIFLPLETTNAVAQSSLHPMLQHADVCYPDLIVIQYLIIINSEHVRKIYPWTS